MARKLLLATLAIASLTLASCGRSTPPEESTPDANSSSPALEESSPTPTQNTTPQSSPASEPQESASELKELPERDCDGDGLMDRPYDLDGDGTEDGCDINHGSAE